MTGCGIRVQLEPDRSRILEDTVASGGSQQVYGKVGVSDDRKCRKKRHLLRFDYLLTLRPMSCTVLM